MDLKILTLGLSIPRKMLRFDLVLDSLVCILQYLLLILAQRTDNLSCFMRWEFDKHVVAIDGSGFGRSFDHQLIQD